MEHLLLVILAIMMLFHESSYAENLSPVCSSSCGNIPNITSPFRLTTDPSSCGDFRYNLSCENNIPVLYLPVIRDDQFTSYNEYQRYYVKAINYNNYTIRVVDPNIHKDDCSSIPNNTVSLQDLYVGRRRTFNGEILLSLSYNESERGYPRRKLLENVIFFNCENPVLNSSFIDAAPCLLNGSFASVAPFRYSRRHYYSYYYVLDYSSQLSFSDLEESCWIQQVTVISKREDIDRNNASCDDIHKNLVYGFQLSWIQSFDKTESRICYIQEDSNRVRCVSSCFIKLYLSDSQSYECDLFEKILRYVEYYLYYKGGYIYIVGLLAPRTTFGVSFVIALLIYKWRRRHLSLYDGIEEFLQSHNNLMPIRYSYRDIRRMTKGFKDKLGEGGFGSVYKGQLCSGPLVAVKMLGKSKGNGQDFINEVATIGRIHHANVVRLIGFCVEGSRRALVYDFMLNGSLDKFVFSREGKNISLSFMEMFEISLGIARGIDYLHRGCDMQILHFDIKPHNILLDENFIPKICDFGLARLCPLDNSIVSLTAARGTFGYIAPEMLYKNIGRVSYKADIYSFGMLLMEMASRRKNLNSNTENLSHIFFPLWIYDKFNEGKDIEIAENVTEEESKAIQKMIIVALWCIQLKPCERPTMSKVIDMLESNLECLQMAPKPYLYPQEQEKHNVDDAKETSFSSTQSEEDSTEISLISHAYN